MSTATVVNFPTCTRRDCPDNAPYVNHDHRFESDHQIWFTVGRLLAESARMGNVRRYEGLLILADTMLAGVNYAVKSWVVHYARVDLGWVIPAMGREVRV